MLYAIIRYIQTGNPGSDKRIAFANWKAPRFDQLLRSS